MYSRGLTEKMTKWTMISFSLAGLLYRDEKDFFSFCIGTYELNFEEHVHNCVWEKATDYFGKQKVFFHGLFSPFNNRGPKLSPFVIKCTIAPQNIKRSDTNNMKYIGQSVPRVDALEKVKGKAIFASDMVLPGQAYLKMLMAHRPHAIVKRVDISKAEAMPGVLTVLTARDVPCNEFGYYTYDQPVFCGQSEKLYTDRVRFVGDRVAAVVAETESIAAKARDLIEVEYEDLPVVCDVEEAMQPAAPVLHPDRGQQCFWASQAVQRGCRGWVSPGRCDC